MVAHKKWNVRIYICRLT